MRGVINTLVFSVALRTGGPLGNQAECRSAFYPGQQWQREDGTACTKRHMRWLWAGCGVPEVAWPSCALKQNHCKIKKPKYKTMGQSHVNLTSLILPDAIHRWFESVVRKHQLKTWRLSLTLSWAWRSQTPVGQLGRRLGLNLFSTWEENQILLHFHQLSVSERYFCRTGQEMMLLDYGASQGPRHFVLVGYRCSIDVSHRNHPSFPWLSTFFQQNLPKKQFRSPWSVWFCYFSVSLSLTLCSCLGLICACFGFKHKINSAKVS